MCPLTRLEESLLSIRYSNGGLCVIQVVWSMVCACRVCSVVLFFLCDPEEGGFRLEYFLKFGALWRITWGAGGTSSVSARRWS